MHIAHSQGAQQLDSRCPACMSRVHAGLAPHAQPPHRAHDSEFNSTPTGITSDQGRSPSYPAAMSEHTRLLASGLTKADGVRSCSQLHLGHQSIQLVVQLCAFQTHGASTPLDRCRYGRQS